jgi:hypothetical protein
MPPMRYWMATHFPKPDAFVSWSIYFRFPPADPPGIKDRVLFYETAIPETKGGKRGRKGIVREAHVSEAISDNRHGNWHKWRHKFDCAGHAELFVPLEKVRTVIPWPFYRQTVIELEKSEYDQLLVLAGRKISN